MTNAIERFRALFSEIKRPGAEKLLEYLESSDFYTAPASTRFHSCHEGGLLEHSINVCDCLIKKRDNPIWKDILCEISTESLLICSLLHDVCKIDYYVQEWKNKKVYSETGSKQDAQGRYDWQTVPGYTVDEKLPYGHGEKSVYIINGFMRLNREESLAIRFHMGFTEPKEMWGALGKAIEQFPLVLALHEADLEATYLLEEKE